MAQFGITTTGFNLKPFAVILNEKAERAREMFGSDVDLRSTSALRKLLDISSFEDHELWKGMEQLYYSNFVSTASGDALDLLGEDVGVSRRFLNATGKIQFKLSGGAPRRVVHLPIGTIVQTGPPVQRFRTLAPATLSEQSKQAVVDLEAMNRGPAGNVAANAIDKINPVYAQHHLALGGATIAVKNEAPTTGGELLENDASYRDLLLGHPRTLWTLEAVRYVVKNIDGVRDCRLFDPIGGVDTSLSKFGFFKFGQRPFGTQRLIGTPYFFNILVALHPGFLWESEGNLTGVRETIEAAIREVRPVSIFPNLLLANNVLIGIRANVVIQFGHDPNAVLAAIKVSLERRVNALGLGSTVLYSEVLCDCMEVPGVVDVQGLHLRRCPPRFGMINFGRSPHFQSAAIEAAVGENIALQPDEIANFEFEELIDITVSEQ